MPVKPKLPRTCGCAARGGHRKSCPQAKPRAARRRKKGSHQDILESVDLTTLRRLPQASVAKKLGVSANTLCTYLKKHPLEHEGEGVEGEGVEGEGGEKPWSSLEDVYLIRILHSGLEIKKWITDQLPGRDADAARRRMRSLEIEKEAEARTARRAAAAEEAARRAATARRTEAARRAAAAWRAEAARCAAEAMRRAEDARRAAVAEEEGVRRVAAEEAWRVVAEE